jgi:hypothetical protein
MSSATPRTALLLASVLLTSCGEPARPAPAVTGAAAAPQPHTTASPSGEGSATATAEVTTLASNTQATFDDVRVGAGNFRDEEYTDESGAKRRGRTGGLWIYVRGDASQDRKLRAHPGASFTAGQQRFEVVAVEAETVSLSVSRRQ